MTIVTFGKHNGRIVSVECKGHTGYGESGEDIVCAALSAMVQSCALGILKVVGIDAKYKTDDLTGYLKLELPKDLPQDKAHDAEVLLETLAKSVEDLTADYHQYVKSEVKEL
ncbi:MAG: ribosomal-processing cysteine protease Prp [Clostridia bacterium]|nr:ribosomal-processing cysteine protease Prp [Clostridia bacterium]